MLSQKAITESATAAKILSSEARIKILNLLIEHGTKDVCVKEIAEVIDLSHSATSHQLAKLQDMGVITCSRKGQTMCYTLTTSPLTRTITRILTHIVK